VSLHRAPRMALLLALLVARGAVAQEPTEPGPPQQADTDIQPIQPIQPKEEQEASEPAAGEASEQDAADAAPPGEFAGNGLVDAEEAARTADLAGREAAFYPLDTLLPPEGVVLEVGGLLALPDDELLLATRRGEIWRVSGASGEAPLWTLWADGLQEPLGLLARDGWIYCVQRGELLRMADADRDGRADRYETVCDDWQLSGSYHEYAFGPAEDGDGNLWVTLNIPFDGEPFGRVDWRGWALRIPPGGPMQPVVGGLRSPCGIGSSPWGEIFYTDNQGEWCGASKFAALREGDFHGHPWGAASARRPESRVADPGEVPDGVLMPVAARRVPGLVLPAVWFPYDVTGRSPSGFVWDGSDGAFGPFAGQVFVGDQYGASLMRVCLEQVAGVWQGAVIPFRHGLDSGVVRVAQDERGALWAGLTDRGWASLGRRSWGLQRVRWSGETPFELQRVEARHDGFHLEFTASLDPLIATDPGRLALRRFTYELHSDYGSDELDDWPLDIEGLALSGEGKVLDVVVDGLKEGYVHELLLEGLRDVDGRSLLHPAAWYTLQKRPGGSLPPRVLRVVAEDTHAAETSFSELAFRLRNQHGVSCLSVDAQGASDLAWRAALRDADLIVLDLHGAVLPAARLELLLDALTSGRPFLCRMTPKALAGCEEPEAEVVERLATLQSELLAWPRESGSELRQLEAGVNPDGHPAVWSELRRGARLLLTTRSLTELLADRHGPLSDQAILWALDLAPSPEPVP